MSRRAFTLLEVMVALVVGALVVTLAYGTLRGGMDTQAQVARVHDEQETLTVLRSMLTDALRHARVGDARDGATGLQLIARPDGTLDQLAFRSRGIEAPLGATREWRVTLRTGATGLVLDADPPSGSRTTPLGLHAGAARTATVRLRSVADTVWRTTWPDSTRLPAAVEITLFDSAGTSLGAPLVVRTAPGGQP